MEHAAELSQSLVDLGLTKPEADVYIQLLLLQGAGPATGYQVAKALGKDATGVYKALEELKRRGAVETVAGRGKQYRPLPPAELLRRLGREHSRLRHRTETGLAALTPPPNDEEVFRLHDREQVFDRFRSELAAVRGVALLDLSPRLFRRFSREIREADRRGVVIVCKLYEPSRDKSTAEVRTIVDIEGKISQELMPGDVLRGVFDCSRQLMAYLPRRAAGNQVMLAYWSANAFMAYQAHQGLANGLQQAALKADLAEGEPADRMLERLDELERLCHGSVDWERVWARCGLVPREPEPLRRGIVCEEPEPLQMLLREEPVMESLSGRISDIGEARPRRSFQAELLQRKRRTVKKGKSHDQHSYKKRDPED